MFLRWLPNFQRTVICCSFNLLFFFCLLFYFASFSVLTLDDYVVEFNWFQLVDLLKKIPNFDNSTVIAHKQVSFNKKKKKNEQK
jgi:hypothetical protein